MSAPITRGQLLSRSAKGGAALLVAGSALGPVRRDGGGRSAAAGRPRLRAPAGRRRAARVGLLHAGDRGGEHGPDGHEVSEARLRQRAGALSVGRRDRQRRRPDARRLRRHRLQLSGTGRSRARSRSSSSPSSSRRRSSAPTSARSAASRPTASRPASRRSRRARRSTPPTSRPRRGGKAFSLLVPAGAHHRPGLERARRVHGLGSAMVTTHALERGHVAVLSHHLVARARRRLRVCSAPAAPRPGRAARRRGSRSSRARR